jgi:hypothetical protein
MLGNRSDQNRAVVRRKIPSAPLGKITVYLFVLHPSISLSARCILVGVSFQLVLLLTSYLSFLF